MTSPSTLIVLLPCPTCDQQVPWHYDQSRAQAEPRCPQPTCNVSRVEER